MRTFLVAACALGLSCGLCGAVNAQKVEPIPELAPVPGAAGAEAAAPANPDGVETRRVRLSHVTPSTMAYWLDPLGRAEPVIYTIARENAPQLAGDIDKQMRASLPRPNLAAGVSIEEVRARENALMLSGEPEALDQWEREIRALDRPLRRVEVEAMMVRLPPEALGQLGVEWGTLLKEPGPHLLGPDAGPKIRGLAQAKPSPLVSAPRVTAIVGLAASSQAWAQVPGLRGPRRILGPAATVSAPTSPVVVQRRTGLAALVRSVEDGDGPLDLTVAVGASLWIESAEGPLPLRRAQQVSFRALAGRWYLLPAAPGFAPPAPGGKEKGEAKVGALDEEGRASFILIVARPIQRYEASGPPGT